MGLADYFDAITLVDRAWAMRARDVEARGINPRWLTIMDPGLIVRHSRGVYARRGVTVPPVLLASKRAPRARFCLLSAAHLHGLVSEPPHIWLAVHGAAWLPIIDNPPVEIIEMSAKPFNHGATQLPALQGRLELPTFTVAKTIADCLKFRARIGEAVAFSLLESVIRERRATREELLAAADACRVTSVMEPRLYGL